MAGRVGHVHIAGQSRTEGFHHVTQNWGKPGPYELFLKFFIYFIQITIQSLTDTVESETREKDMLENMNYFGSGNTNIALGIHTCWLEDLTYLVFGNLFMPLIFFFLSMVLGNKHSLCIKQYPQAFCLVLFLLSCLDWAGSCNPPASAWQSAKQCQSRGSDRTQHSRASSCSMAALECLVLTAHRMWS